MLKDIKSSFKHSAIYGLGNLATKLVGFILIPIYTDSKYLSVADYGALSILEISSQLLVAILGLSLYQGYIRWYWDFKTDEDRKKMFFSVLSTVCVLSVVFTLLSLFFSSFLSNLIFSNTNYSYIIILVIINSALLSIQTVPNSAMRIQTKSVLFSGLNLIKLFAVLLITIYFVVVLKKGIAGIFEAQIIGNIFYFLLCSKYIYTNIVISFQTKLVKELFRYSYPLILASISGIVLATIDRYSLNYLANLDDVGVYSLGFKFANTIKIFIVVSVQMALTPMMLQKINTPNNKRFYSKVLTYFSYGLMFVILTFSMFTNELVGTFTVEEQYMQAVIIMPIIAIMIFFGMMKDTVIIGLHVNKKTNIIGSIITLMAILNLGLNALLIPLWGILGAALATLLAQIIFFWAIYYYAQKSYPVPYEIFKIIKIVLVAITLYCVSLISNNWDWQYAILFKLILVSTYPILLYFLNFYEDIEIETIKHFFRSILKRP